MPQTGHTALIIIDLQNDYFPGGQYPLFNTEAVLTQTEAAIARAHARNMPVILVQHIADSSKGIAPFFNANTNGAAIVPRILAAAPEATIIVKHYADSFIGTTLEATLTQLGISKLLICGMMTQNCVTHTAISKSAEKYEVAILQDCCTTVDGMLHQIALHAVSTRVPLLAMADAL